MYVIYFVENNFKLSIELEDYLDEDKFNNYVIFLKSIYIMYEGNKFWNIPYKRIDEIIMWFDYHEYEYRIMPEAQIELKNFKDNNFKREYKFNRTKNFDLSVYSDKVVLYDYLKEGCNWSIKRNRAYIADDAGLGKCQSIDTPILTINGWKLLKDIKIGDVVFSSSGKSCNVIGIYPQGKKDIYKINFTDGTSTNSCLEHLWVCMTDNNKRRNQGWQIKPLEKIKKEKTKHWIPVVKPIEFEEKEFKISPYVLGVLIGDGYLCGTGISISNPENDIMERVIKETFSLCKLGKVDYYKNHKRYNLIGLLKNKNNLLYEIRNLKLNIKSTYKFIPENYMLGSVKQRIDLLHGLMDTDGTCQIKKNNRSCSCSYSTSSKKLAEDIKQLVLSLGGRSKIHLYKEREYVVQILLMFNPFWCKIKSLKWIKPTQNKPSKIFKSIEFMENKEAVCISVDSSDKTYITENYIVTHNTIESIGLFSQLYKENKIDGIFIVVKIGTSYNWKKEILKFSNIFKEEDIEIILNKNKIKPFEKNKNKKIIIISNHLLRYVFASYRKDYSKIKLSKIRWNKSYVDIFDKWNKNSLALIIDEVHEFKNSSSLRSKSIQAHKNFFEYRFILSATPAINYFENYWNQFNILDESIIPYSENAFKIYISKEIGDKYSSYTIREYNHKNIKEIKDRISPFIIQRLKKDLPEVKTKQFIKPIYLEMSEKQRKLYDIFIDYTIKELKKEYDFIDLKLIFEKYFAYILQIIDNPLLLEGKINDEKFNKLLNSWKITDDSRFIYTKSVLKTYIEDFDEKVILFDNHPKTLDFLYEQFKKYNPLIVHGHTKDNEETKLEKQDLFNDKNSKYKLFLLSSLIGGSSWNLENACRRELFYILPYDTTITRQAFDRVYRITSKYDSIIEMLIIDKSIDNLRYLKNVKRIEINDNFLRKNLSEDEIKSLFLGILNTNN